LIFDHTLLGKDCLAGGEMVMFSYLRFMLSDTRTHGFVDYKKTAFSSRELRHWVAAIEMVQSNVDSSMPLVVFAQRTFLAGRVAAG
jgi:hypothetical protein